MKKILFTALLAALCSGLCAQEPKDTVEEEFPPALIYIGRASSLGSNMFSPLDLTVNDVNVGSITNSQSLVVEIQSPVVTVCGNLKYHKKSNTAMTFNAVPGGKYYLSYNNSTGKFEKMSGGERLFARAKKVKLANDDNSWNTFAKAGQSALADSGAEAMPVSDVDVNIPLTSANNAETFAVIIANQNYRNESSVSFAINDGSTFSEYCTRTLGIPQQNIHFIKDATFLDIKNQIEWMKQVEKAYGSNARMIFYYAGHGFPDESSKESYLLPVDGIGSSSSTGYKLSELYAQLSENPTRSTVVFLDACFSGGGRDGSLLQSARGVAIRAKASAPAGNMVVFSAAQGDQTAYPYKEKSHGLFTYFLLKKLQETSGDVKLGDLADYLADSVNKMSIVANSKNQTPTAAWSAEIKDWKSLKLK